MTTVNNWHKKVGHYVIDNRKMEARIFGGDLVNSKGEVLEKCEYKGTKRTVTQNEFDKLIK